MKTVLFTCLSLVCSLARAQTYDLSITIDWSPTYASTFSGSFTYSNGVLSDVNVSDPIYGGSFTTGSVFTSGNEQSVDLIDHYYGPPGSTYIAGLGFELLSPLGGKGPIRVDTNSIVIGTGNQDGTCGPSETNYNLGLPCSATLTRVTAAPEISFDGTLLTLLGGFLCVVRGARKSRV